MARHIATHVTPENLGLTSALVVGLPVDYIGLNQRVNAETALTKVEHVCAAGRRYHEQDDE